MEEPTGDQLHPNSFTSSATATPVPTSVPDAIMGGVTNAPPAGNENDEMFAHTKRQLELLGKRVQKLVHGIKELEQLGVETKDLPLPKIIVVGDQSAGKSSLIEGISGITVPRSSGTCTRCPLQITLSDDTHWSCRVSLQKRYVYHDNSQSQGRYGKWREESITNTAAETLFAVVNDKAQLEDIILRAQWAILNPKDKPEDYLTKEYQVKESIPDLSFQAEFSPNRVILDITAPGQPALAFIDLPGIIRQTGMTEDNWLVDLVENCVTDYIKQDNSLVLLARPMESDFANSSSAALIGKCGALYRTVGCLTKPDRYEPGSPLTAIRNVLNGKTFQVGHGYFVTKQPSQDMLTKGTSPEQARETEELFFASEPWSTEFRAFQDRFGTVKLRDSLSLKLLDQIRDSLPDIRSRIDFRLQQVESELIGYPDPPTNAIGHVMEALNVFTSSIEKQVDGTKPSCNQLRNTLKETSNSFLRKLEKLRPTLFVNTPDEYRRQIGYVSLLSDDEDEDVETTPCPKGSQSNNKRKHTPAPVASTSKKIKLDSTVKGRTNTPTTNAQPGKKTFRMLEIRETLNSLTSSNVANEVDPRAVDYLRKLTLEGWDQPMLDFIDQVTKEFQISLAGLLQEACAKWIATTFYEEASNIVRRFVSHIMAEQLVYANRTLKIEQHTPITLNDKILQYHKANELEVLREGREVQRVREKLEAQEETSGRQLFTKTELREKARTDLKHRADLGEDIFDNEVRVMASIRGYYNLAMSRFVDHVDQGIRVEVLVKLTTELPAELKRGLRLEDADAQDHCASLLAEDLERENRRLELRAEREKLVEAQKKLDHLALVE